ncbi:MAG: UDP-N-acetylmuramoyl-tripeptide--D-alanyl-D-alanine ligase [Deltaproteobacteria bacterium]|nr:UDP-N-acetylmuramoyl-tripeptide--D-alanyl-D-alanine ligase [Deltaproteobacteria bacterium]
MSWTLPRILAATGGELARWGAGPFSGFSTDSRQARPGEVFVALVGPRFDGNEFVAAALARGAAAAIVSRDFGLAPGDAAWIRVGDGLRALGELAAARRRELPVRVVGVTGSNGKTTTKEMIAAVLAAGGRKVAKSAGTENNLVGLPQTLLRLEGDEDFAVLEMGMNHAGEIWRLAEIARPDVGVITNVVAAHLEGLGSLANVAAAKQELALALRPGATLVVNGADPRLRDIAERFAGPKILAGGGGTIEAVSVEASAEGQRVEIDVAGSRVRVDLRVRGAHNVQNALLAVAVGRAFGLGADAIAAALAAFQPPAMRLELVLLPSGARILNDAYNANPASVEAALAVLAAEPGGRRIAVLGDMCELGADEARYHREVGAAAARARVDRLVAVGRHAAEVAAGAISGGLAADRVDRCGTAEEAAELLGPRLAGDDVVLVKGSRAAKMEAVIERLRGLG